MLFFFSISKAFTKKETKTPLNLPTKVNSFVVFFFVFFCGFFLLQMLRPEEWLQIEISKISEKYIIYLYISVCLLFKFHIPLKVVIQSVAAEGGSSAGPGGSVVLPWVFEFPVDQAGSGKGPRLPDSLYIGRQQTPEPVAPAGFHLFLF